MDIIIEDTNSKINDALNYFISHLDSNLIWDDVISCFYDLMHRETQNYISNRKEKIYSFEVGKYPSNNFHWYMFLVHLYINDRMTYPENEGRKIFSFFETIGVYLKDIDKIDNIDSKINLLVNKKKYNPDTIMFEIIVALYYIRNSFDIVKFIPTNSDKTPDLFLKKNGIEFYCECKTYTSDSAYWSEEYKQITVMLKRLFNLSYKQNKCVIFEINFKDEVIQIQKSNSHDKVLTLMNDDTLVDLCKDAINDIAEGEDKIVRNDKVDIKISYLKFHT